MEKTLMLTILSDHLHRRKTVLPADTDMMGLAALSRVHQVDGIVYMQCGCPPIPSMAEGYGAATFYYANRTRLMAKISAALTERAIPFFTVKGLNVAKYYPVPALRTMSDCDIVVPPEQMNAAVEVMRSLGFTPASETFRYEWGGDLNGMHVEVHDRLVRPEECPSDAHVAFFNDFMPYVTDNTLDRNFHFLFLLIHLRRHLVGTGAGVRPLFDLAVILQNGEPLNTAWIEEKLDMLGLCPFANTCFTLIEDWFSVRAPIAFDRLGDEAAARAAELILQIGAVAGGDDNGRVKSMYALGKGPLWWKYVRSAVLAVFPSYRTMRAYPGMDYLKGKPWLLPVAWVHRWGRLLKRGDTAKTRQTLERTLISKSELAGQKEYLKELGIE